MIFSEEKQRLFEGLQAQYDRESKAVDRGEKALEEFQYPAELEDPQLHREWRIWQHQTMQREIAEYEARRQAKVRTAKAA
jgi:hypothetical protein